MQYSVLNHARFYEYLDQAVKRARVRNAAGFGVRGFPFLRANRFFAGIKSGIIDDHQKNLWIELLRRYDLIERSKEIQNLPVSALSELESQMPKKFSSAQELFERLVFYSERYLQAERARGKLFERVSRACAAKSLYSLPMRVFGLNPLAAPVITFATSPAYKQIRRRHITPPEALPIRGELTTFSCARKIDSSSVPLAGMLEGGRRNALGMPELSHEELEIIALAYAPFLTIDIAEEYDRFGEVFWKKGVVSIDTSHPAVYYYPSYAIIHGKPHIQMNYAFWYTGRYGSNAPLIERGRLDGMTVRLTLQEDGVPLMVDIINNCGCYFFYVPNKQRVVEVIKRRGRLDPLIPSWLPEEFPREPLRLRINSGWHQVENVDAGAIAASRSYDLVSYETLESLRHADGCSESVFDHRGIMKNSRRMRQRGNHAIKLFGRAHFTDPRLYERDFVFK